MRRFWILFIGALVMISLFGCGKKENKPQKIEVSEGIEISVLNQVEETNIWIISDTDKNRKASVWGTATLSKFKTEDKQNVKIPMSENENLYLIRMIDVEQMYYAADGIALNKDYAIIIRNGDDPMSAIVEVYDESGTIVNTYEMFMARL